MRGLLTLSWVLINIILLCSGCTDIPPFTLTHPVDGLPASGPKVASLVANLKCELWDAANDRTPLPVYLDSPDLREHAPFKNKTSEREFTLKNLFEEIDFIAEAQFTLDVTGTSAASPSVTWAIPFAPSTNLALTVGGQLSDAAHRNINLYTSVDGDRLVSVAPEKRYTDLEEKPSLVAYAPQLPCDSGSELSGSIGLKETLKTSLISERMNDVAVFQSSPSPSSSGGNNTVNGAPAPSQLSNYAFGQIGAQIDFTITEAVTGGPNWTITKTAGVAGGLSSSGYTRLVKDTLVITFVPVCIREKYYPKSWDKDEVDFYNPSHPKAVAYPMQYEPEPGVGTPGWVDYLPPCHSTQGIQAKALAPEKARLNNLSIQGLGILQQGLQ